MTTATRPADRRVQRETARLIQDLGWLIHSEKEQDLAVEGLVKIGQPAIGLVVKALLENKPLSQEQEMRLLIGDRPINWERMDAQRADRVEALLKDEQNVPVLKLQNIRVGAARVLERIGDAGALPALAQVESEATASGDGELLEKVQAAIKAINARGGVFVPDTNVRDDITLGLESDSDRKQLAALKAAELKHLPLVIKRMYMWENDERFTSVALKKIEEMGDAGFNGVKDAFASPEEGFSQGAMITARRMYEKTKGKGPAAQKIKETFAPLAVSALQNHSSRLTRGQAARVIGVLGEAGAIDLLIEKLKTDERYVRIQASEALYTIGDVKATDALLEALKNDKDDRVRENCVYALGRIYFRHGDTLGEKKAVVYKAILDSLNDLQENVVRGSINVLAKVGGKDAVDELRELVQRLDEARAAEVVAARVKGGVVRGMQLQEAAEKAVAEITGRTSG